MLTRDQARGLRGRLQELLDGSGWDDFKATVGSCTYGAVATFKVEISPVGLNGETTSKEAEDFKRYASFFGLKPEDLGRKIKYAGNNYVITGFKPKSRRFPVLATRSDGKTFRLPVEAVK